MSSRSNPPPARGATKPISIFHKHP
jgi:hypothetical protein